MYFLCCSSNMTIRMGNLLIVICLSCCLIVKPCYSVRDTIQQGQQLSDWDNLTSANGLFVLAFFSLRNSRDRYLGISFNGDFSHQNTVWVANRDRPIPYSSAYLKLDTDGVLKILHSGNNQSIELNSVASKANASVTLLDSGNLELRELDSDGSKGRVLWQSFDYPTDKIISGMKLGINIRTGHTWKLTSWLTYYIPASGSYSLELDPNGTSQLIIWWRGEVYWTSGPWLDGNFQYLPGFFDSNINVSYVQDENEKYFTFTSTRETTANYWMFPDGSIQGTRGWKSLSRCNTPREGCVGERMPWCRISFPLIDIVRGYMSGLPFKSDRSKLSIFDCQQKCLRDCSCLAYSSSNGNETGCNLWDQRSVFRNDSYAPVTFYFPRTPKEAGEEAGEKADDKARIWIILAVCGAAAVISFFCCFCILRRRVKSRGQDADQEMLSELRVDSGLAISSSKGRGHDLQSFSFESLMAATDNFSVANKLGEGGFGPVYKGKLPDGKLIAIKRLSRSSGQGLVEFKNEISLIAKLQHDNLVRLLGYCIRGEEKLLIYEYMPNKSLDFFLFNPSSESHLEWNKRLNIVEGIAQGLIYLHKYSRLRVVHRDLKASNILLDDEWNPKISDFGLARIFRKHETHANTNRVVGTYGYMSPEYAMEGIFSTKSDVFSFGVLLLEIISGKKNNSSFHLENSLNLIGYAWKLWKQGRPLEIMDPRLAKSYQSDEALRCIHVALLCVQENPSDRPTMSDVISIIANAATPPSMPKQPAFIIGRSSAESTISSGTAENFSENNVSITEMQPR